MLILTDRLNSAVYSGTLYFLSCREGNTGIMQDDLVGVKENEDEVSRLK